MEQVKRGWRNHYRPGMPFPERFSKDLKSLFASINYRFSNGGKLPRIISYPDYPSKRTTLQKIAKHLKYELTNRPLTQSDLVVFFDDRTKKDALEAEWIGSTRVLNQHCLDISKQRVEEVHQSVFGYGTFVDPLQFEGRAVMKSDDNAMHDGRYIDCPVQQIEPGVIYQIVLDNMVDPETAVDIRVPVIGNTIPLAYQKFKTKELRFTNEVKTSSLHTPEELFDSKELEDIVAFVASMNADFCELDVIRNKDDGKIYIIDVNTTPYGPPVGLSESDTKKAVHLLANSFSSQFL